jgi:transglutaminase-like putative cysteine protease
MTSHRLTLSTAIATVLTGISLYPLFMGTAWFWAGLGATITVAGVATLTRLRRLPVVVCFAATALGLLVYLNLVFEAGHSLGHVLPTLRSLELLGRLVHTGVTEAGKYAPPAPELPGIVLLGSGGIGIVALLTDLIAVRLRSVALAGIPLLLLITEPFAVSASRSWVGTVVAFCLGTVGYLGMLSAESTQRIREWEQPRPGVHDGPDTSALSAAGRRVGITSVVLALCLPIFVPGLHVTRLIGGQPGIGGGSGSGTAGGAGLPAIESVVSQDLRESARQPVLTYSATGNGPTVPQYLQLYVLDDLTDTGWQPAIQPAVNLAASRGVMPRPPGLDYEGGYKATVNSVAYEVPTVPGATPVGTTFTLTPGFSLAPPQGITASAVLPVPYPATEVVADGGWLANETDLTLYSTIPVGSDFRYSVFSADLQPSAADLDAAGPPPPAIKQAYLSLPGSYTASGYLANVAGQVTEGQSTAFGKAEALQSWLGNSGGFSYSLNASPITNAAQLTSFLTSSKKGYCQQFAVAMADLARLVHIPSRVVIGYTSGTRLRNGTWQVTTADAHEWPELYFEGYGWLRFEPTPTGADGQGSATVPSYATEQTGTPEGKGGSSTLPILPTTSSSGKPNPNVPAGIRRALGGEGGQAGTSPSRHATRSPAWDIIGLVVAGLLVLALIAPSATRLAIRRRRWGRAARGGDAELAHAAWQELQDDLVNYRAGYSPSETPRALRARLGAQVKAAEIKAGETGTGEAGGRLGVAALERITQAEERARYATHPASGGRLRQDSSEFRRALAATMPMNTRWRARVLPLSVLAPTASSVSQAADAVGNIRLPRPRQRRGRSAPRG